MIRSRLGPPSGGGGRSSLRGLRRSCHRVLTTTQEPGVLSIRAVTLTANTVSSLPSGLYAQPPSAHELFGYAVHHALRARFCIERGRYWQAEYWISGVRDHAMSLACLRRSLPVDYGRGFDDLPTDVRDAFAGSLATSLERNELMRALCSDIAGLMRDADGVQALASKVEPQLRMLTAEWDR